MTRIRLHPTALLLLFLPCLGILNGWQTAILWSSAALHETGHLLAFQICNCPVESLTILPFGLCAIPDESRSLSYKDEVFCAAAGPVFNLVLAALLLALPLSPQWVAARYALYCNVSLFAINSLPVLPLDGGRVLFFSLLTRNDPASGERICKTVALILLILLFFPSCFALIHEKNPSLLLIWFYLAWNTRIRRGSI